MSIRTIYLIPEFMIWSFQSVPFFSEIEIGKKRKSWLINFLFTFWLPRWEIAPHREISENHLFLAHSHRDNYVSGNLSLEYQSNVRIWIFMRPKSGILCFKSSYGPSSLNVIAYLMEEKEGLRKSWWVVMKHPLPLSYTKQTTKQTNK